MSIDYKLLEQAVTWVTAVDPKLLVVAPVVGLASCVVTATKLAIARKK